MHYKHISKEERRIIEESRPEESSNKKLAEELVRSASTIGLELKGNYGYGARCYKHERAQKLADKSRKESKRAENQQKNLWNGVRIVQKRFQSGTNCEPCNGKSRKHLSQDLFGNLSGTLGTTIKGTF